MTRESAFGFYLDELLTLRSQPESRTIPDLFEIKVPVFSERIEPLASPLVRKAKMVCHFRSGENRVWRVLEELQNLPVGYCFPPARHGLIPPFVGPYYHRLDSCSGQISLRETTKLECYNRCLNESYTRARRCSGPPSENEPDPTAWTVGPDGLSWIGTKAMLSNDSRGLENSVRHAESIENHYSCPRCGEPVESISANAPGAHELGCGCEATISTRDAVKATATRLVADGGQPKAPQKSETEADTCSCCGEPFSRLGRLCADCWAANCNSFIEECRAEDPTPITDGGTVACQNEDCGLVAVVEVQSLEANEGRKLCEPCAIQELRPGKAVPDGGTDAGAKIQGYFEEETVHVAGHQCRAAAVPADDGHALRMVYECQQCGYASNHVTEFVRNACEVAE